MKIRKIIENKKGLLYLSTSVLILFFPALVFAYSSDINFVIKGWLQIIVILLFILIVSLLLNKKYFKISLKNKRLFLITVAPLILIHLIFSTLFGLEVMKEMKKIEEYKIMHPNCGTNLSQSDPDPAQWGNISPPCYILDLRGPLLSSANKVLNFLFLYYLLTMAYGIYYLRKTDKNIGAGILKFCSSVIIMIAVAYIFIIIISTPVYRI